MITAVFIGDAEGWARATFTTGPYRLVKNERPINQDAILGARPERIITPAKTCIIPNTAKVISSGCMPASTGAQESGEKAQSERHIPIVAIVLRPVLRIGQPLRCGRIYVKIGTIPIMIMLAMMCHKANLREDDESTVRIVSPDSIPPPINTINNRINHQGIPRLRIGDKLRSA